ncbi:MAG TPA: RNA 2',3'-cyclic phosphodiesterase [Micromonosporaceae bacterium]
MNPSATVEGSDRHRLFCALTLPDPVLDRLVEWQRATLAGHERVVPRANLHVTIAFLGSRPAADVLVVAGELRAAAGSAAPIRLAAGGYRETRSVGMVVLDDHGGHAGRLAVEVFERLERAGVYEPERRRWLPHVTVLRFRRPPKLRPSLPDLGEFSPSGAAVYHSLLRPGGAQYEILESFALNRPNLGG